MAKGNVEVWLGDLLNQAMNSLHAVIRDAYHAINDGGFNLMSFLGQFASQVPSLVFFDYSICMSHICQYQSARCAKAIIHCLRCSYSFTA